MTRSLSLSFSLSGYTRTHSRTHVHTHARTHASKQASTHAREVSSTSETLPKRIRWRRRRGPHPLRVPSCHCRRGATRRDATLLRDLSPLRRPREITRATTADRHLISSRKQSAHNEELPAWLAGSSVGNAHRPTVVTEPGLRARRARMTRKTSSFSAENGPRFLGENARLRFLACATVRSRAAREFVRSNNGSWRNVSSATYTCSSRAHFRALLTCRSYIRYCVTLEKFYRISYYLRLFNEKCELILNSRTKRKL